MGCGYKFLLALPLTLMGCGGIDSNSLTTRLDVLNGVSIASAGRMRSETTSPTVPQTIAKNGSQRLLLPHIKRKTQSTNDTDILRINENITYLHRRLFTENLELNEPEINTIHHLFLDPYFWTEINIYVKELLKSLGLMS